jgi:hypothetical protein
MFLRPITSWGQLLDTPQADMQTYRPRAENRTHVRHVADLDAMCQVADAVGPTPFQARITNISRGGVGMVADRSFERGAILSVELASESTAASNVLLACVLHATLIGPDEWALGCIFATDLTDDDLHTFGFASSKADPTEPKPAPPCFVKASFRPQRLGDREWIGARVSELSQCGVGLVAPQRVDVGTLVRLELRNFWERATVTTSARVVRLSQRSGGEWFLGCNFIEEIAAQGCRDLLATPSCNAGRNLSNRVKRKLLHPIRGQQSALCMGAFGTSQETAELFSARPTHRNASPSRYVG